jgi:two-component system, chemotaxis family, protein-glutamate methylesterase/glutaminase
VPNRDIIVIGGSSGATAPLKAILGSLPADLPAAVLVVLHIPARSVGILATVASAASKLPVQQAADGMAINPGNIYIGAPDRHMIVVDGHIKLGTGPRENMARPAIDPLFRSAAAAYGPRAIGLILSGLLNDGASGLQAIKRCGGVALVQDPVDAIAGEMPLSALQATDVDLSVPAARLGDVLSDMVRQSPGPGLPVPPDIRLEVDIAAGERVDTGIIARLGKPAALTCPNCGGVLNEIEGSKPLRFRCQVGHALTAEAVAKEQENAVDEALRIALRVIEERAELVARMAEDALRTGRGTIAELYAERAAEYRRYEETIRKAVVLNLPSFGSATDEGGQEDV